MIHIHMYFVHGSGHANLQSVVACNITVHVDATWFLRNLMRNLHLFFWLALVELWMSDAKFLPAIIINMFP